MKLHGKIFELNEVAEGIYEIVIARKTKGQVLYAVFLLLGNKWLSDLEILEVGQSIDVHFVARAKNYTDKNGKSRWFNNLIVSRLVYPQQQENQQNIYSSLNAFDKQKEG